MKIDEITESFDSRKGYSVSRDNLEPDELQVYDRYLLKLNNPTDDQLRMLATFAWLACELKIVTENRKLALYIRKCLIYARNRLCLWRPVPVSRFELLLDCDREWPEYYFLYLDDAWEIPDGED